MKTFGQIRRRTKSKPDSWEVLETPAEREASRQKKVLLTRLVETSLPVRITNCLEAHQILTVDDLSNQHRDSLLKIKNFGSKTLDQVKKLFKELGIETRTPKSW